MATENRKTINLPSGGQLTVRRPGPLAVRILSGAQGKPGNRRRAEATEANPEVDAAAYDAAIAFVCTCAVEPRLTSQDASPDGATFIDDALTAGDFNFVLSELIDFAGLVKAEELTRPLSATGSSS